MSSIQAIIQKQTHALQRMENILSRLSNKQKTTTKVLGNWTVKDILAHLIFWDSTVIGEMQQIRNGEMPMTIGLLDKEVDQMNDKAVAARRQTPLEEIEALWKKTALEIITELKKISDEEYMKIFIRREDNENISIARIFEYTYEGLQHTEAHAKQIEDYFGTKESALKRNIP